MMKENYCKLWEGDRARGRAGVESPNFALAGLPPCTASLEFGAAERPFH